MNKHKKLTISTLKTKLYNYGDNFERAKMVFSKYGPEQMQQEYGESGQTPAQILADYEKDYTDVKEAIDWLTSLPD